MHILIDTNIYLDLILNRGQLSIAAKDFFKNAIKAKSKLFLSATSLRDIGYIVSRLFHDQKMGKNAQVKAYELCHKVISLSNDAAIEALYSNVKDYEDALLVEIAKENAIDLIITNNIKDFKDALFPVWTPKYFNEVIDRI